MANRAVATRLFGDGSSVERSLCRGAVLAEVRELVKKAPKDKYGTVRQLLADARAGKVDCEVFKEFVRQTNTISMVEEMFEWDKYQREVKWGVKL